MKSKTLSILLTIPFVVGLLSFVSITILNNTVAADINDISWEYEDETGFKVNSLTELKAKAVYDDGILLAPRSNELVWSVKNADSVSEPYATIEIQNDKSYLKANKKGVSIVTCSNKRGTKSKSFKAHIYDNGTIIVNRKRKSSGKNVDPVYYIGQFDMDYSSLNKDTFKKKNAKFEIKPKLLGEKGNLIIEPLTSNIEIDNNVVTIKNPGLAKIHIRMDASPYISTNYEFKIVENGFNIYNYNDLLMATNFSDDAKNIVLQVNLESLKNTYLSEKAPDYTDENNHVNFINKKLPNKENTELFGNFDFENQKFNFNNELISLDSTYNTKYIDQFNKEKGTNVSKQIKVGINLKGDLYGNGFTINGHELAFPNHGIYDRKPYIVPQKDDYFFGPLPYVALGNLNDLIVVKAHGQDNSLVFLNGDNLLINDVNLKNTNEITNMYDLLYTGSVIDVNGKNNTIKNSILSNGRTVVRAFSSDGLTIDNCILKNAGEFIMKVGSNLINNYDENKDINLTYDDVNYSSKMKDFFNINDENSAMNVIYNQILQDGPVSDSDFEKVMKFISIVQKGLDNDKFNFLNDKKYQDTINLKRTYFSNSGIFSLAFDSLFNGPFLYNGATNFINNLVKNFDSVVPNKIGGTSLPTKIIIDDESRFYDWKDASKIDPGILIEENISSIIGNDVSINDFFPMRQLLLEEAKKNKLIYNKEDKNFINTKVAYYGGGLNLSKIEFSGDKTKLDISDELLVDIARRVIKGDDLANDSILLMLAKAVISVIGSNPFRFIINSEVTSTPNDFYESPKIEDLINNTKGE